MAASAKPWGKQVPMQGAAFHAVVDQTTPSEWSRCLSRFSDANIYQTWAYGAVRWGEQNVSHIRLMRGDSVVAMAQLATVRSSRLGIGIAHLRWGPICHLRDLELDPEVCRQIAMALHEEYVKKQGLYLRVLPNAYLGTHRASVISAAFPQFSVGAFRPGESYRTISLNLSRSLDDLRDGFRKRWRRDLS